MPARAMTVLTFAELRPDSNTMSQKASMIFCLEISVSSALVAIILSPAEDEGTGGNNFIETFSGCLVRF